MHRWHLPLVDVLAVPQMVVAVLRRPSVSFITRSPAQTAIFFLRPVMRPRGRMLGRMQLAVSRAIEEQLPSGLAAVVGS